MSPGRRPDDSEDANDRYGPVAAWRGLSAVDVASGTASLSLLVHEAGAVVRFRLAVEDLIALMGACATELAAYAVRTNSQPPSSSGSPARDVSIPFEGENT